MGAWIEILREIPAERRPEVAPFMGAWIEIHHNRAGPWIRRDVAPFMGAWIEIKSSGLPLDHRHRRTLHGCVD